MAKRLLLDVLVKVLGEFIELNEDNLDLSLAVWSGHIALKDLKVFNCSCFLKAKSFIHIHLNFCMQLKTHKLLRNFDISILHGEIKTLDITIPWTALLNSPVKVIIDGVNLQVGPLNLAALDKEETKKRVIAAKMQKLRMVDRFIDFSSWGPSGDTIVSEPHHIEGSTTRGQTPPATTPIARATYMQQWTSKIIDNIEITLRNVHLRYEDSQTIPGTPFSAGITLNSFTLATCDEKWREKFVARDINKPSSSIRKMANVSNFGFYWMTKSVILSNETFTSWSAKMQEYVYPGLSGADNSLFGEMMYILHPANNLIIRLTHNERTAENIPKFDMVVESTNLPMRIDRVQYLQLLRTMEMIGVTERKRQPHMYRPYVRPNTPQNARAWWKYACKMIIKRGRYIKLVKLSKTISGETGLMDIRTPSEKKESQEMEVRMPLRALVIFRHAAAKELHNDCRRINLRKEREELSKIQGEIAKNVPLDNSGQRTWIGWAVGLESKTAANGKKRRNSVGGSGAVLDGVAEVGGGRGEVAGEEEREGEEGDGDGDDLKGDVSIASIISSLEEKDEVMSGDKSASLFRLSLTTSSSLEVLIAGASVASATMTLTLLADVSTWGVTATVRMGDLLIVDNISPNPSLKNIISVKTNASTRSSFIANTESKNDSEKENELEGDNDSDKCQEKKKINVNISNTAIVSPTKIASTSDNGAYLGDVRKAVGTHLDDVTASVKHDTNPTMSITYENLNGKTAVKLSALPLEIAVNKLCVQQLIGMFLAPASSSTPTSTPSSTSTTKTDSKKFSKGFQSVPNSFSPKKKMFPKELRRKSSQFFIEGSQSGSDEIDFKFRVVDDYDEGDGEGVVKESRRGSVVDGDEEETVGGIKKRKTRESRDRKESEKEEKNTDTDAVTGVRVTEGVREGVGDVNNTPTAQQSMQDGGFEIVFDVQAPNIIIPHDDSSDRGCLLLDSGYLAVRGFFGPLGMTWDVTLRDVNAFMPRTVQGMYGFKESSLYLIKPFDITAKVQTTDTSSADMTVDVQVSPEVRGELDTSKLARLLQMMPIISETFSRHSCLNSVAAADRAMLPPSPVSVPTYTRTPRIVPTLTPSEVSTHTREEIEREMEKDMERERDREGGKEIGGGRDNYFNTPRIDSAVLDRVPDEDLEKDGDGDIYGTPPESPPDRIGLLYGHIPKGMRTRKETEEGGMRRREVEDDDLDLSISDNLGAILANTGSGFPSPEGDLDADSVVEVQDPALISMVINLKISEVALDLTYDVPKGRHLVLALRMLEMKILFRPYDMQIFFDLNELSIQDSLRSDAQRDLARTPRGEKSLIHISYTNMSSRLSPFYKRHATEVVVEFATLGLNFDVNTIMHLRPFLVVLLTKKTSTPNPVQTLDQTPDQIPTPLSTHLSTEYPDTPFKTPSSLSPLPTRTKQEGMHTDTKIKSQKGKEEKEKEKKVEHTHAHLQNQSTDSLTSRTLDPQEADSCLQELIGMHIAITVSNVTLDLLRTSTLDTEGAPLASAFTLQILDLRADIDILQLVRADVKLRSLDIIDARVASADYVFKKVFCPVVDMNASVAGWRRSVDAVSQSVGDAQREKEKEVVEEDIEAERRNSSNETPPDLLHVTYAQTSSNISTVDVTVLNVTSFVSIDTILDLSYVAMDNAFAVLDLIASPPAQPDGPDTDSVCGSDSACPETSDIIAEKGHDVPSALRQDVKEDKEVVKGEEIVEGGVVSNVEKISGQLYRTSTVQESSTRNNDSVNNINNINDNYDVDTAYKLAPLPSEVPLPSPQGKHNSPALATYAYDQCTTPVNTAHTSSDPVPHTSSTTMSVIVNVAHPRIIFLEDPTTDESKAIVGSCSIQVHYSRENRWYPGISVLTKAQNRELRESLHVSVHNQEVFVLRSMAAWYPQPIIDPMGMEFNLRRRSMNSIVLSSIMSIDLDRIDARVSISDMMLAESILTRRSLIEPPPTPTTSTPIQATDTTVKKESSTSENTQNPGGKISSGEDTPGPSPTFSMSLNMGATSLVGINDYNGQNVPLVRTTLYGCTFFAEGNELTTRGEGSVIMSADFYNPKISVWEPIMDRWHPSLSLTLWVLGSSVEIKSDHTMQLSVSGAMLGVLLQAYSSVFRSENVTEREEVPDVLISNFLGTDIPIEICDSATGVQIMILKGNQSKPVPRVLGSKTHTRSSFSLRNIPPVVDLNFFGTFREERQPVRHLPFNISRPRACNLYPKLVPMGGRDFQGGETRSDGGQQLVSLPVVYEPIVEEVYESARYDPIMGRWRQPYLPGDPFTWTDASCIGSRDKDIHTVELLSDKWEWLDQWTVDLDSTINGDEIDSDGWEYAASFAGFSIASKRRVSRAMDCVRRRRWHRTRVPIASSIDERYRPLTVFWDVQILQSGTRKVDIRSGLMVLNYMPFSVMIALEGSAWTGTIEFGPIEENQTFHIPLLQASASLIRMKPTSFPFNWSQSVPCCMYTHDVSTTRDVHCEGLTADTPDSADSSSGNSGGDGDGGGSGSGSGIGGYREETSPVCMRIISVQKSISLQISIVPFVTIANRLPCHIQYTCNSTDINRDGGYLLAGATCKLTNISLSFLPKISFRLGNNQWSAQQKIDPLNPDPTAVTILDVAGNVAVILTMLVKTDSATGTVEVSVCSKGVLLDRTGGLGVLLWTGRGQGNKEELTRTTTCLSTQSDSTFPAAGKPKVSNIEKKKRRAAVRAAGRLTAKCGKNSAVPSTGPVPAILSSEEIYESNTESGMIGVSLTGTEVVNDRKCSIGKDGAGGGEDKLYQSCADRMDSDDGSVCSSDSISVCSLDGDDEGEGEGHGIEEVEGDKERKTGLNCFREFTVHSARQYSVVRVWVGDRVYSDREFRWTHLPPYLNGHQCVRTAYDDRMTRSKVHIKFTVTRPSIVLVLIDMRTIKSPPKWVLEEEYRKVRDQAVARSAQSGILQEMFYGIYGKYYEKGACVQLRGNWSKDTQSMYCVFVIPAPTEEQLSATSPSIVPPLIRHTQPINPDATKENMTVTLSNDKNIHLKKLYEEVTYNSTYDRTRASLNWIEGGSGVTLYHAVDDNVSVGLLSGEVWSDEFNIDMTTSPHTGSFEVVDWVTMKAYQLSYSICHMPGLFSFTQMLTITSRYCIVNCLEESLMLAQRGSQEIVEISPYQSQGWHKSKVSSGTSVQIRTTNTLWSLGCIDLNELGRRVIHLPRRDSNTRPNACEPYVVVIEVKAAETLDPCSVMIVVWQATQVKGAALSVRNDSDVYVTIKQADIETDQMGVDKAAFDVCVAPYHSTPYGWADPDSSSDILVTAGTSLAGERLRIARLDLLNAGEQLRLPDNSNRVGAQGEIVLSVLAEGGGRVLLISRSVDPGSSNSKNSQSSSSTSPASTEGVRSFGLSFGLASFGLSLVVEKPIRREFFSMYIDGLEGRVKTKGSMRSFEFMITDLQVDNYSETVVYPVLLHSTKKEIHKSVDLFQRGQENDDDVGENEVDKNEHIAQCKLDSWSKGEVPWLQMTLIEELAGESSDGSTSSSSSSILKYVAIRILPLALEVESATIQLLYVDLISQLHFIDHEQAAATSSPEKWMENFNFNITSPCERDASVDVYRSQLSAQASKMCIEKLVIHPVKITLTFVQTAFPRKTGENSFQTTALNFLTSLAGVDRMQLRLKSFEVEDVFESWGSLVDLIAHKTLMDLQSQLAQIAGSLTVIGSPIGFARKVGSGVKSFFYEPYQGAVLGPQDFVVGLGRGTSHLLANVVSGAMNSTVAIVGTASKGISLLTGDSEYVRRRALKRQRNRANRGGIMDGILDGSESVISGITSGVSGLVTKPFEEARKNGVQGFFRGLGLGLIGAAVKPVMGITDGLTSVASGVSNQVGVASVHVLVRPPRAFERSASDASDLVLVPLNLEAAFAQEFVSKRSKSIGYEDVFLSYIPLDNAGEAIVLSETYVYWRKPKSLWGRTWANISHCYVLLNSVGVVLYGGETEAVMIPCGSRHAAVKAYAALAHNAHRMGSPGHIIPSDLVTVERSTSSTAGRLDLEKQQAKAMSPAGLIEGYRFGFANATVLRRIIGPECDVLKRIAGRMDSGYLTWAQLDESVWRLVWEWHCTHSGLQASRCCATVIINKSLSPLQISRVQIVHGKNVLLLGSIATGYEAESRAIMPGGSAVVFIWAFSPSPIEIGHLKALISTAAFTTTVASTQRESCLEAKGSFNVGFLEKSVSSWWSKYAILVS